MDGEPIAVLYPSARSTPYELRPLPSCYIHFRAYVRRNTSGQGWLKVPGNPRVKNALVDIFF